MISHYLEYAGDFGEERSQRLHIGSHKRMILELPEEGLVGLHALLVSRSRPVGFDRTVGIESEQHHLKE